MTNMKTASTTTADQWRTVSSFTTLIVLTVLLASGSTTAFTAPAKGSLMHPGSLVPEFSSEGSSCTGLLSPSRLFYRDGNEVETHDPTRSSSPVRNLAGWWSGQAAQPKAAMQQEGSTQEEVDRYLEFLGKRYKQFNNKSEVEEVPKKFSILEWLNADGGNARVSSQDDALYALGVAGLASKELLAKHHLIDSRSLREAKDEGEGIIQAETAPTTATGRAVSASSNMMRRLNERRLAFIRYQQQRIDSAVWLATKTAVQAPFKAAKVLWNVGGGKRNLALAVTVLTTVFLLVRPVVAAVLSLLYDYSIAP